MALAWLGAASGCASVSETYYWKAQSFEVDPATQVRTRIGPANFFRVKIRARSLFSTSQYAAGWHDTEAVETLFGELKGPGKVVSVDRVELEGHREREDGAVDLRSLEALAEQDPKVASSAAPGDTAEPGLGTPGSPAQGDEPLAPRIETLMGGVDSLDTGESTGKTFVIFHSSNADALVNQIRTLVGRRTVQEDLVRLVTASDRSGALDAEHAVAVNKERDRVLLAELDRLATRLESAGAQTDADPDGPRLERELASALRRLIVEGNSVDQAASVVDRASANEWLMAHPTAFVGSGGTR